MGRKREKIFFVKKYKEKSIWMKAIRCVGSDFKNRVYKDQKNYERIDERQFACCWIHHRLLSQYLIIKLSTFHANRRGFSIG
jgi:hypothetical protein